VDGHGDHAALSEKYKGKAYVLKTSGPRGHTVDAKVIASAALKEVDMLRALGCKTICILTDRESRQQSCTSFLNAIQTRLPAPSKALTVIATCADRMIENWILADIVQVSKACKDLKSGQKQKNWEGTHGKNELKKCMAKGINYNEVKHGKKFFCAVRDQIARKNSASLNHFLSKTSL